MTYNPKVNEDLQGWMRVHDATLEQAVIALEYATSEDEAREWLTERGKRLVECGLATDLDDAQHLLVPHSSPIRAPRPV